MTMPVTVSPGLAHTSAAHGLPDAPLVHAAPLTSVSDGCATLFCAVHMADASLPLGQATVTESAPDFST
jgi:hypothetical protein